MTFVNELISEEEKNTFDFSIIELPYQPRPRLYKWTIDRERNAFLIWVRQVREPPHHEIYAFIWKGLRFEPWLLYKGEKSTNGKWIHIWTIDNVYLPKNFPLLNKDHDEMRAALEEALLVEKTAEFQQFDNVEEIRIENPLKQGVQ
ncbi:hypothetical protein [Methylomonas rapida]|uniref:Uncharacterized protein n=1 Tax=Methylomonas rapida TaxID=2963939 RepID=A0ABY7GFM2_9GAMM|nr:hypothetical protein [Methylomonas rapida]WAR43266.1 hypothetical protein NM686_012790 [Methylomonas rapida]